MKWFYVDITYFDLQLYVNERVLCWHNTFWFTFISWRHIFLLLLLLYKTLYTSLYSVYFTTTHILLIFLSSLKLQLPGWIEQSTQTTVMKIDFFIVFYIKMKEVVSNNDANKEAWIRKQNLISLASLSKN